MSALRAILKIAGKGESKVAAVFGITPEQCHRAVAHVRAGAPDIPVWLFSLSEPAPETVALCKLVLVRLSSARLAFDAYRLLWPYWVGLSVVPWVGEHGRWPLKLVPFLMPPFRVLIQNRSGDFLPGSPRGILRHLEVLARDTADNVWNALRTASHAIGDVWRNTRAVVDTGIGPFAVGTVLGWLSDPHARFFRRLHGDSPLTVPASRREGIGVMRFESSGSRWNSAKLENAARNSNAEWILWGAGDWPNELPFDDPLTFAVSRQPYFRAWKKLLFPTAPFRTLQPEEFSRVAAPLAPTILVNRRKLLALGIPRTRLALTAWMLLFWKAAAAGWHSYSAGQDAPLKEQPDFPTHESAFLLHLLRDRALRLLGPRDPDLARGSIAFARPPAPPDPERLRVLLLTPFLPYPLAHGGAVRIYNLCRALAARVDFTLVALREKHDRVDYANLHEVFRDVYVVDIDESASGDDQLPQQVRGHQSSSLRALIADLAPRADLLQIEYTHMAAFRDAAPAIPAILVEHDLTFHLYRQLAASKPSPAADVEYRRWLDFERQWLPAYDGVWTVSEEDRATVLQDVGRDPASTFNVPNGVDIRRFVPAPLPEGPPEIFYVGSFRHLPNILGFEKLRREVMPRVWQSIPDARLRVVAGPRYEDYWKDRDASDPRIELHGFVEDLRPLYARASVVAVPLGVSAGTNIKVLEAMASGRAVVSTSVGCAGLGLTDGVDIVVCDLWSEFAGAACELLRDAGGRERIAAAARRTAEQRYSWDAIADTAFASYQALVSR